MSKIYLVIGSDIDGAFIDDDCIFYNKDEAKDKLKDLSGKYGASTIFTVEEIDIDKEKMEDD